jgi:hypothetical protein
MNYIGWCIIAWFVVLVFGTIRGLVKKRGLYGFKVAVNSAWPFVVILWILYFLLAAVSLTPKVVNWANYQISISADKSSYQVWDWFPVVYLLSVIVLVVVVFYRACSKPLLRYNSKEQELEKASNLRLKTWLRRLLRRVKRG